jgi:predicted dienelactone hydrolase
MFVNRQIPTIRLFPVALVALVAAIAGPTAAWSDCRGATPRQTADFAARGSHGVGVLTLHFVDDTRPTPPNGTFAGTAFRTLDVEMWYPSAMPPGPTAVRGAPLDASGARYPLILYGHALQDFRTGEAYLTEHLASRGYIVAAIDFPLGKFGAPGGPTPGDIGNQPGDLRFVLDHLLAGDGGFADAIDAERIGASGLSLGGGTALLLTYHRDLRDPRIRAVLPIAPAFSCAFTHRFYVHSRVPMLVLQGDADRLAPLAENGLRVVRAAHAPQTLAVLRGASHLGFLGIAGALGTPASIDQIGCDGLAGFQFPALPNARRAGIASEACLLPCQGPSPAATLDFNRQHELTQIVAAAFFDASLGEDRSAACWLQRGLAAENPDATTLRR